jgi:hypothetical protein
MKTLALAFAMSVVSLAAARPASATTQTWSVSGQSCSVYFPNGASGVQPPLSTHFGIGSVDTTPVDVTCPVPYALPPMDFVTSGSLQVTGYSRSSTDHVACSLTGTNMWGTVVGTGTASLPLNQGAGQFSTGSASFNAASNMALTCHIPGNPFGFQGLSGGNGTSWLTNIVVYLTNL